MERKLRSPKRRFILAVMKLAIVACSLLFATTIYARGIEPRWFDIKTVNISITGLSPAFEGYKIVQLSDLHARTAVMDRDELAYVAELANHQQPDLIALTGDYITNNGDVENENKNGARSESMLANAFSLMRAKDGIVAVMGNHDRSENTSVPLERALAAGKIKLLNNAVYSLDRGGNLLNIVGLDDPLTRHADVPSAIAQLPRSGVNIVLAHEPDFAEVTAAYSRFDLQLSGHSHGGQVILPFIPKITPELAQKYMRGLYRVSSKMQLYVSSGVGTSGKIKARFNCRPEISVIVLHRATSKSLA